MSPSIYYQVVAAMCTFLMYSGCECIVVQYAPDLNICQVRSQIHIDSYAQCSLLLFLSGEGRSMYLVHNSKKQFQKIFDHSNNENEKIFNLIKKCMVRYMQLIQPYHQIIFSHFSVKICNKNFKTTQEEEELVDCKKTTSYLLQIQKKSFVRRSKCI